MEGKGKMKRIPTAKNIKFRCYAVKRGHAAKRMADLGLGDLDIAIAKAKVAKTIPYWAALNAK